MSIPWPFPKGGDREGKAVTTPEEDKERDNPWALPKEKAKGGHTETTTLALSEGKDQWRINGDDPLAPPSSKG